MKQKAILKTILLFGLITFLASCGETIVDEVAYENYVFNNNSTYDIEIEGHTNGVEYIFPIGVSETLSQKITLNSVDNTNDKIITMDSIKIIFDNNRISTFYQGINTSSPYNIFMIDNYTTTQISGNESKHEYIFTIEDYNNAE